MKIRGKDKFAVPRKVVRLGRTITGEEGTPDAGKESLEELTIRVRALPVGTETKMFDLFPEPPKPQEWAKDAKGVVLRDPETKKPMVVDVETPEWREASRKATHGRMGYIIFHGIDDPGVEKPAKPERDTPEFYSSFFEELVAFGFTMGDLGLLMTEITNLMNLSEDIEKQRGN